MNQLYYHFYQHLCSKYQAYLEERERDFDLDFGVRSKLPEYDALLDSNMQHYFENPDLQKLLLKTGQVRNMKMRKLVQAIF